MDKIISAKAAIHGFFYPFRGFMFIVRNPRLLAYVTIPALINALLYALFIWYTSTRIHQWISSLIPEGEGWYWAVLFYIALALAGILVLTLIIYTFTIVGGIILSPFNDLLSEKVDLLYSGNIPETPFQMKAALKDMARALKAEAGRVLIYLTGFGLLLLLNLFPPVGTAVYGIAITVFTMYFIGWEYFDYSMERYKLTFGQKMKTNMKNSPALLSFGAGAAIALMFPIINLAAIPVCVTGATLLYCDLKKAGRIKDGQASRVD